MENNLKQKTRIAGAFTKHFLHFGFKKTTVDDVASELGISKKTIYKFFNSKEDIFYFIISRKAEARRVMIEKELKKITTARAKIETMIRINISEFRKIHKKKGHAFADSFQYEIASGAFRQAFYSLVSEIIEEGVKDGEFADFNHEMTIRYVQALITETIRSIVENDASQPEDFLICTIHKLLAKSD
ncbi:MAG: TetR/AcrR family transcriptional regulator [Bacteroidales bacterium]|nr:TetR/AcrR family transcriptional regulator [Bacteroidales bacterium]